MPTLTAADGSGPHDCIEVIECFNSAVGGFSFLQAGGPGQAPVVRAVSEIPYRLIDRLQQRWL